MYRKAIFSFIDNSSSNPITIEGTVDMHGPYLSVDYHMGGSRAQHIEGNFHWLLNLLAWAMMEYNSDEPQPINTGNRCSWAVSYLDENLQSCVDYSGKTDSLENINIEPISHLYKFVSKVVSKPEYIQG